MQTRTRKVATKHVLEPRLPSLPAMSKGLEVGEEIGMPGTGERVRVVEINVGPYVHKGGKTTTEGIQFVRVEAL